MDSIAKSRFTSFFAGNRRNLLIALAAAFVVALVGYYVVVTRASGFFANAEPTKGTISGNASLITDNTASTGQAVMFNEPPTTTPPPTNPTGGCPALPAFPDENCTGYKHTGVTLRNCNGNITTANTTLEGCLFDGGVTIQAANVTIKKSLVKGIIVATYVTNWDLVGLRLEDVEIDGGGNDPYGQAAVGYENYTCIRCNVHNTGRGANIGDGARIEDSYFHDFVYVNGAHQSGVGSNAGTNMRITHNNIACNSGGCSGALVMYGDFGKVDDVIIKDNLFNTTGSYCTYGGSTGTESGKAYPHGTNITISNNLYGKKYNAKCGYYGPSAAWEYNAGNVWDNNIWGDTATWNSTTKRWTGTAVAPY